MKRVAVIFGVAAAFCAGPGLALDIDPVSRAKAVAAASVPAKAASKSIVAAVPTHDPLPDLPYSMATRGHAESGACDKDSSALCYDYKEKRLVYRPSRNWMPEISGLRAEHISVRRDSVVFKYSFR